MKRQMALLDERYDLATTPAPGVTMSRGKPVQEGVRVKLPPGMTWDQLAKHDARRDQEHATSFPAGFLPLPHPNHAEGGMLFPKFHIDEIKKQEEARPDALRPGFRHSRPLPARVPAADLSDHAARPGRRVARGSWSRIDNYYELFNGILNPKQIEGLRLLVTPFPQQQFNQTEDRRTRASQPRRHLLRLPRQRPHQRAPRTWWATFGRRSSATASTRPRCAA